MLVNDFIATDCVITMRVVNNWSARYFNETADLNHTKKVTLPEKKRPWVSWLRDVFWLICWQMLEYWMCYLACVFVCSFLVEREHEVGIKKTTHQGLWHKNKSVKKKPHHYCNLLCMSCTTRLNWKKIERVVKINNWDIFFFRIK